MQKGDIILVPFPFTDLSGNKIRPALILAVSEHDVTVAFISTQFQWKEKTDLLISPSRQNGLKKDSVIRLSKLATLEHSLALGLLGQIDEATITIVNDNLKIYLQIT